MSTNSNNTNLLRKNDNSMTDKDWLDLSWNYFSLLSEQRMGMIDFYIVIEVALIGALFTLIGKDSRILWTECTVAITITFISVFFFILDHRTKEMIHSCERVITHIEEKYRNEESDIRFPFHLIEYMTEKKSTKKCIINRRKITYSWVFRIQFFAIGSFGLACFIFLLLGMI